MFVFDWYVSCLDIWEGGLTDADYPYDTIEEAQNWWKEIDLPKDQKEAVGRTNAIKLFKLPLEL